MAITVGQIRAARAMFGLKQAELAAKAGISTGTLNNLERGFQTDPKLSTLRAIEQALTRAGIEFSTTERGGTGIMFHPPAALSGKLKVLVIDDNPADRKLYRTWLTQIPGQPYEICEANDAIAGYQAFIDQQPACILLDFMMYGKNGFQLLVEMKKDQTPLPPILFITASFNPAIKRAVLDAGAQAYLDKQQLTPVVLQTAVTQALS